MPDVYESSVEMWRCMRMLLHEHSNRFPVLDQNMRAETAAMTAAPKVVTEVAPSSLFA